MAIPVRGRGEGEEGNTCKHGRVSLELYNYGHKAPMRLYHVAVGWWTVTARQEEEDEQ